MTGDKRTFIVARLKQLITQVETAPSPRHVNMVVEDAADGITCYSICVSEYAEIVGVDMKTNISEANE